MDGRAFWPHENQRSDRERSQARDKMHPTERQKIEIHESRLRWTVTGNLRGLSSANIDQGHTARKAMAGAHPPSVTSMFELDAGAPIVERDPAALVRDIDHLGAGLRPPD